MPSHSFGVTWSNGSTTVAKTATVTADEQIELQATLSASSTNVLHTLALDVSEMKAAYLCCTADCTVKTNSSSAPDATINLTANVPVCWYTGGNGSNPFITTDVTKVYLTCADGGTIYIAALQDPTP